MHTVVIVIHLMLVLALIGAVLLQKSEGGGLGIGSTGGFMTSRGSANVLTRATAILAAGFFLTSLALSIIAGHSRAPTSIIPSSQQGGGGVFNQLGGGAQQQQQPTGPAGPAAPAAPAAPSGPQVPQSQ
jgi:preprotein translocase subunit SecG